MAAFCPVKFIIISAGNWNISVSHSLADSSIFLSGIEKSSAIHRWCGIIINTDFSLEANTPIRFKAKVLNFFLPFLEDVLLTWIRAVHLLFHSPRPWIKSLGTKMRMFGMIAYLLVETCIKVDMTDLRHSVTLSHFPRVR